MKGLLFTYLLTFGGGLASLANPFIGLCVYVAFSILKPEALWPWSVPAGNYSRIVAIGMLLGWIFNGCGVPKFGRAAPIAALLAAFFGWCVLAAVQAPDQAVAWHYIDLMLKIRLPVLVGLTLLNSVDRLRTLAWVIVLSAGYVAFELNLSYLKGYNILQEQGFAGMDNNSAAIAFVTALGVAFFLGMSVTVAWQKAVAFGIAALLAHAVLFSFSRGAMLATAVAACVAFLMVPRRPSHYATFAMAIVVAVSLAGNEVRERLSTAFLAGDEREASAQSRLDLWRDCWDVIQKNPVFGAGPDHWPLLAHTYGWPAGKEAHSLWVQNAAELGVPGMLLLLAFYVLTMRRLWPLTKESTPVSDPFHRGVARMVVMSLVGFVIAAQFVSLEALEIPYYVALLGAGTIRLQSLTPVPDLEDEDYDDEPFDGDDPHEEFDGDNDDDRTAVRDSRDLAATLTA